MGIFARNYYCFRSRPPQIFAAITICNRRSRNYFARPHNLSPQPVSNQSVGGFYKLPTYRSGFVTQGEHL
jgi:hypothetical protein